MATVLCKQCKHFIPCIACQLVCGARKDHANCGCCNQIPDGWNFKPLVKYADIFCLCRGYTPIDGADAVPVVKRTSILDEIV